MITKNFYLTVFIIFLCHFMWYFITLPNSYLLPYDDNVQKPKLSTALSRYGLFILPSLIIMYNLTTKMKNGDNQEILNYFKASKL